MIVHVQIEKLENGSWKAFIPGIVGAFVLAPTVEEALRIIRPVGLHIVAEDMMQGKVPCDHSVFFIIQNTGDAAKPQPSSPPADPASK